MEGAVTFDLKQCIDRDSLEHLKERHCRRSCRATKSGVRDIPNRALVPRRRYPLHDGGTADIQPDRIDRARRIYPPPLLLVDVVFHQYGDRHIP